MGQRRQQVVLWIYLLQEQNSLMILFYPRFPPCSTKVIKISQPVPNKMTSLAPYLITKYFPLLLHSSLAGTFLAAVSLKFSSLGWRGRKAASFPFPLIKIKMKAFDADGFGKTRAWKLFRCWSGRSRGADGSLGEACAPLEDEVRDYRQLLLFLSLFPAQYKAATPFF